MSKSARFGPVQVEFRDDGSLFIYQPSPDIVLGKGRAWDLVQWLTEHRSPRSLNWEPGPAQSTVPEGVVNTSAGPSLYERDFAQDMKDPEFRAAYEEAELELLSATEREADRNAEPGRSDVIEEFLAAGIADVEAGNVKPVPPSVLFDENTRIQDLRKAAKAAGLPAGGTKADLLKRLGVSERGPQDRSEGP